MKITNNKIPNTDVKIIKLSDGRDYTIKLDRKRYFYPDEWNKFIKEVKSPTRELLEFMINTGARFDEAIHIRRKDFDFDRNNVRLWKTKTKAKKGETTGKPRTLSLSTMFSKKMKKFSKDKKLDEYLFMKTLQGVSYILKQKLKKIGIKDWWNFSTHNLRKTHGMYLKALGIGMEEICNRLGHDYNTYLQHYGSADIFSDKDLILIKELLGDLYSRRRQF